MDCPTFGTTENHLARRVQSLDRKAKGDFNNSDRNKVLISRTPKRHRSITALNFYLPPPSRKESTPPPPPYAAPQRPPPRFLDLFKPPTTDGTAVSATHSGTSTPGSEVSSSSQPVTPHMAQHSSPATTRQRAPSYFPYMPRKQKSTDVPRLMQRKINHSASQQQHQHENSADEWDNDEDIEYPTVHPSVYLRESDEWAEHEIPTSSGLDMVGGTFGRV